ncbi:ParM/StbA family protein, partial [bacterium]
MTIAGIDIGYGNIKVVSDEITTVFPTIITPAREGGFDVGIGNNVLPIEVNGKQFYVGEDAEKSAFKLDIRYKSWFLEDEYIAFYKKAIFLLKPGFLTIVTGLPVNEYNECRGKLKNRLKIRFQADGNFFNVEDVRVMPQPFGSFYNFVLDHEGNITREKSLTETVGIIDIGYRTTDYILISSGKYTEGEVSGTIDTGIS